MSRTGGGDCRSRGSISNAWVHSPSSTPIATSARATPDAVQIATTATSRYALKLSKPLLNNPATPFSGQLKPISSFTNTLFYAYMHTEGNKKNINTLQKRPKVITLQNKYDLLPISDPYNSERVSCHGDDTSFSDKALAVFVRKESSHSMRFACSGPTQPVGNAASASSSFAIRVVSDAKLLIVASCQ